jgi:hypothetical protein
MTKTDSTADKLAAMRRENSERMERLARLGATVPIESILVFRQDVLLELLDELDVIDVNEFFLRFELDFAKSLDEALEAARTAGNGLVLPS